MLEISNEKNLKQYLLDKKIVNTEDDFTFKYCLGGVSCTVAFVCSGNKQLIIKQGLAQLKVREEWLCDPNRMDIEYRGNSIYHTLVPDCAPQVYFYDGENYIYGREAIPENWHVWKSDLLDGLLDFRVAKKVIHALLTVHNECAQNNKVALEFENKDFFYNLRVSPYFEFTKEKYPQLSQYYHEVISFLMESKITLVHGDFSPKNILTNNGSVSILDYEVAHFGHPAFDLGFFSTHFILKAVKNKAWAESYLNMLVYMIDYYFKKVDYMDKNELLRCYIKTWALIVIARVDGKSPAEYISSSDDKILLRKIAFEIIQNETTSLINVVQKVLEKIKGVKTDDRLYNF